MQMTSVSLFLQTDPITKSALSMVALVMFWWYLRTFVIAEDLILAKLGQTMFILTILTWASPAVEVVSSKYVTYHVYLTEICTSL